MKNVLHTVILIMLLGINQTMQKRCWSYIAKQYGLQVVAATEKGAVHYRDVDFRLPTMLIMGNEETGISPDLLKICDQRAKLPIVGEVQSLNVSVAAGVFMYEALEQRNR